MRKLSLKLKAMEIDKRILEELNTFKGCPFCGHKKIKVTTPFRTYVVKSKGIVTKGNQYVYKCEKCDEGFTSTLSDTLSFENFKVILIPLKPKTK